MLFEVVSGVGQGMGVINGVIIVEGKGAVLEGEFNLITKHR